MLLRGGPQDLVSKQNQPQPQGLLASLPSTSQNKPSSQQSKVTITPHTDPSEDSA